MVPLVGIEYLSSGNDDEDQEMGIPDSMEDSEDEA